MCVRRAMSVPDVSLRPRVPFGAQDNPTPADVDAHPRGASAFGVQDLVGNTWQYTSEFQVRRHVCACWWQLPALVRLNRVPCCPFRMPTLARWRCVAARASNRLCSTSRNGTSHRHCSYRNMGNISCLTMRTSGPRLLASAALPMMAARERWMPNKLPRKVTPNRVPVPGTRS